MLEARLIECSSNRKDEPIHHIRRRDDVRTRFGLRDCGASEQLESWIVQDFPGFNYSTMSVFCVFTQTVIGNNQYVLNFALDRTDRLLCDAVFRVSLRSNCVLFLGHPEKND